MEKDNIHFKSPLFLMVNAFRKAKLSKFFFRLKFLGNTTILLNALTRKNRGPIKYMKLSNFYNVTHLLRFNK
jgi:hypothetical protein